MVHLGPWILFVQNGSESALGGVQPPGKQPAPATISGVRPPYVARKGYPTRMTPWTYGVIIGF